MNDRHQVYRKNVQKYATEESRLWKDLRHGFILGSERFVKTIKARYLPDATHQEVPQQKRVSKDRELQRKFGRLKSIIKTPRVDVPKN